jgi:MFS transporter, ACS family, glucarate transporter
MRRWVLVFWLFIVAAVSYLDRNNISIAASTIQAYYGISNVQLGAVFSAFGLGYAFSQPFAGRIADRFGPYRVVAVGMVWWSIFTALTAAVPAGFGWSLMALMVVRVMLGVGESVIFPAGNRLVANWIPKRERGLANGIIFAGVGVGAGVAPPLVTAIVLNRDWHSAFYVSALIGLCVLAVWLFVARDRPEDHTAVSADERAYIRAGLSTDTAGKAARWSDIVANRTAVLLTLSYFTYGYTAYIFFTWFFKYLSEVRGLDLKTSALFGTLPFIAMAICSPLGGWISDALAPRIGGRKARCWMAGMTLACCGLLVALATQVNDARIACLFLAGGAGFLYLAQSAYWTLSANIGGRSAGSLSGVMNMGNQIGGVITAMFTPYLADRFGWTTSFVFAGALCVAGGLLWFLVDPDDQLESMSEERAFASAERP